MAVVNASYVSFTTVVCFSYASQFKFHHLPIKLSFLCHCKKKVFLDSLSAINKSSVCETVVSTGTQLYSFSLLPLLVLAALPGGATVASVFEPFVELVKSWNLPDWLIHWGHPVTWLLCCFPWDLGGYGTYLGFRIRFSDNAVEEKAKAKALHPKLLGGMFFFFALGATGGITSLLTSDKSIFESPHAVTGFIGLTLLKVLRGIRVCAMFIEYWAVGLWHFS